jgi:hypothetical protein
MKAKKGSASNLMTMENPGGIQHKARQDHENEPAEVVIVCEPEGTSLMMGGLHPRYGGNLAHTVKTCHVLLHAQCIDWRQIVRRRWMHWILFLDCSIGKLMLAFVSPR